MSTTTLSIQCKRAYDKPAADDGYRLLIDRIWPRGVSKEALKLDDWDKQLAPSTELRKWFGHEAAKWAAFYQKYHKELREQCSAEKRRELQKIASKGQLTLVYGAKDEQHNNAVALAMWLQDED